jgi:hypothetical protein
MDMMIVTNDVKGRSRSLYDSEHTSDPKSGEGNLHYPYPVLFIASL